MVKLKGPMSSAEASGSLGQAATFSSWKGRAYARAKTVPTNPKSELQVSVRAMLGFLSQRWAALTAANKATWDESAALTEVAPYSAFLSTNLSRWREFHAPGKVWPVTGTGTQPSATFDSATGGVSRATLNLAVTNERTVWGVLIFRSTTTPVTVSRANCIAVMHIPTYGNYHYHDQNLTPGVYYYQARFFIASGAMGPNESQRTATVT